jgi:hypothetical protein
MAVKQRAERTLRTHFDQIPVTAVKKIVQPQDQAEKAVTRPDVPAVKPTADKRRTDAGHFHGVRFYNDPDALCRIVGAFIGEGLGQGTMAIVIATPDHAAGIEECLHSRGIDVASVRGSGDLVMLDAQETLERFMLDDMPNHGAFRNVIGGILTQASRGREQCTIRAYGEMVDVLWRDGREAAAIRLETLWNQLGTTHDFELLCGYSMGNFYKGAAIDDIKAQHSHVVSSDDDASAQVAEL